MVYMLPPGFEPGLSDRESEVLDRTALQELLVPPGFEPGSPAPEADIFDL